MASGIIVTFPTQPLIVCSEILCVFVCLFVSFFHLNYQKDVLFFSWITYYMQCKERTTSMNVSSAMTQGKPEETSLSFLLNS